MVQLVFDVFLFFYGIFRNEIVYIHLVGYRITEASGVEHFVIIVKGFQPFIIFTGSSI